MPATTESAPAPESKWWAQSLTIWGALVTAAATVAPAVGPCLGIDLSPELIRQFGDQAVGTAQALGGLIGTILTIYGRVRATSALGRRQITMRM